jgi:uncharacterized protein YqfA (UPF0365 family)
MAGRKLGQVLGARIVARRAEIDFLHTRCVLTQAADHRVKAVNDAPVSQRLAPPQNFLR